MAEIKGKYTLRAGLSPIVNGYTFTNNDRSAELSAASDFMLTLSCDDIDRPINKVVSLISNNRLNVLRARLLTSGAPGLQPALNSSLAASILIIQTGRRNGNSGARLRPRRAHGHGADGGGMAGGSRNSLRKS